MSKKRSRLKCKKNSAFPSTRRRADDRNVKRMIINATKMLNISVSSIQDCKVRLHNLLLEPESKYQEIVMEEGPKVIKRPRVLSLFDGISTGLVALMQLNVLPDVYFSSEIDATCLSIQRFNFADQIEPIGDICKLDCNKLRALGPIDMLFGGSPCNDLSGANGRKGLTDETGSGQMFLQFLRVHLYFLHKSRLEKTPYTWMFENVSSMEDGVKDIISKYLGCQPIQLCASQWTAQRRRRYFWTNVLMTEAEKEALLSKSSYVTLQEYLCGSGRIANVPLLPTFTSNLDNLQKKQLKPVFYSTKGDSYPFYSELERLMGLPINFTAGPNTQLHERKKVLARTWDVHTIKSLLYYAIRSLVI